MNAWRRALIAVVIGGLSGYVLGSTKSLLIDRIKDLSGENSYRDPDTRTRFILPVRWVRAGPCYTLQMKEA